MKRFFKDVAVVATEAGFVIQLDTREVKTPELRPLVLPTRTLAEAIADEWREQGDMISLEDMHLTKLANTAIDRVPKGRAAMVTELVKYGRHDLVCYRATEPPELARREAAVWDPLLDWVRDRHGISLSTGVGLAHVEQLGEALARLEGALGELVDIELAGLHTATTISGSVVIALALAAGRLNAAEAFAASQVDERFQAEKWGSDGEAEKRARRQEIELESAGRFIALNRP